MGKARVITLEDIKRSKVAAINQHLFTDTKPAKAKRSKYNSTKAEFDGEVFDSKKELNRYKELLLLLKAGEIGHLERQVPFELNEGGSHSLKYYADFVYLITSTGEKIVEDAKGYRTREYLKKKRLMKKIHNITIKEV